MTDTLFDDVEGPARDPRRFVTSEQKRLLALRDGCQCRACSKTYPTPDGLEGAHIKAHSLCGPTELENLCLLCPACNNAFSNGDPVLLRDWQSKAHLVVLSNPTGVHTIEACPGAGKTLFVKSLAMRLLREGLIGGVLIVGPTIEICLQWSSPYQKLHIGLFDDNRSYKSADFHGMAMTYAKLASRPATWSKELARWENETGLPIWVIFDEVHHLGEKASWGEAAEVISTGRPVLNLTGTLWRSAGDRIPNIIYDKNGYAQADYSYTMADALVDGGVLRRPILHGIDGNARLVDRHTMEIEEYDLGGDLPDNLVGHALKSAFDPDSDVLREMLRRADLAAQQHRARSAYADNAVLVVADDVGHAERIAEVIRKTFGEQPVVVHSDLPNSELALNRARQGRAKWIVSVRMISEGVDIPRISAIVYATKICTKLFFIQVVGRAIRLRTDEHIDAVIIYPAIPQFNAFASEIERMVPEDLKPEAQCRECGRPGWTLCPDCRSDDPRVPPPEPRYRPLPAEDAGLSQTRIAGNGDTYAGSAIEELEQKLLDENASPGLAQEAAPLVLAILKSKQADETVATSPKRRRPGGERKVPSMQQVVEDKRNALAKTVNDVAWALCAFIDPRHGKQKDLQLRALPIIHGNLNNHYGLRKGQRDRMSLAQLEEAERLLREGKFDPEPDWYKRRG
jgi:superfamily II DNA or RNA helicase